MNHILIRLLVVLLLAFVPSASIAGTAPAYIVVDADDGKVLSHRSADRLWFPASITKVMTAYVVFRAFEDGTISPNSAVKISKNALNQAPSKMGFKVGTVMTVDNALKMMIVKSANDIAVALAETVGGTERAFIDRMNAEAKRLGMNSTQFNNPNGLPDDKQWTTARDLGVLSRAVWQDFPQYTDYFQIPAIRVGKKILRSQNPLLERYRGANGMKTGYICASGFNMVASATRGGRTIMVVVLGSPSSWERAELASSLLDKGFSRWPAVSGRPDIDTFRSGKVEGTPTNMRKAICSSSARTKRAQTRKADPARTSPKRAFVLMDPVRVFTGGVNVPPRKVPLPRLRPDRDEQQAAVAGGDAASVQ